MLMDQNMGIPILDGEPAEECRPDGKGKRFLLVGGPFGPTFPLGVMPVEYEEEEEDPNP